MTETATQPMTQDQADSRYRGLPVVFITDKDGVARPAPFLMGMQDLSDLFRLHDSGVRFTKASINRYRRMGLRSVKISRSRWFPLPDALDFLDKQQERLKGNQ